MMVARITAGNANTIMAGEDQHGPREHRHLVERHARRAGAQHADDDLDRAGNRRDLDEADAEQPEVGAHAGRIARARQRRVHEPAAGRREIEKERAEENQAADEIGPERERAEPRERQVAGAEHLRQQQNAHRLHGGHREQEHHHRAVHGEDLIVGIGAEEGVARDRELRAHQQRKNARQQEEQERGADIEVADHRVVDRGEDAPALRKRPDALQVFAVLLSPGASSSGDGAAVCGHRLPQTGEIDRDGIEVGGREDAERRHEIAGLDVLTVANEARDVGLRHGARVDADRDGASPRCVRSGTDGARLPPCRGPCGTRRSPQRETAPVPGGRLVEAGSAAGRAWPCSHASNSAGGMATTSSAMSACGPPQNSAHWPRNTPGSVGPQAQVCGAAGDHVDLAAQDSAPRSYGSHRRIAARRGWSGRRECGSRWR